MNSIQQYIQETPKQLTKLMAGADDLFKKISQVAIKRIIITGSGTSYHSGLEMAEVMRQKSGLAVEAIYPFMLTNEFLNNVGADTLVIGISQGGSSFTTYEAMGRAKEKGCLIATMAGEENAYIDGLADYVLTVNIGEETAGAKTKGYYATKLNLLLLAEYLGLASGHISKATFDQDLQSIEKILVEFPKAYQSAEKWLDENKAKLAKAKEIRIVGPANLYGDTLESALKILETCRIPVTGYEFDEFIHGIYNAINEDSTVIFFDDGSEPRLQRMVEVLGEWTNELYVVGMEKSDKQQQLGYAVDVDKQFETFIYPIALQLVAAVLPVVNGYDPSSPKDPQFHMKLQSKKFNH
ncbi:MULTISPECIES: SIS domain-containing protein [Latilactobacillus]|uniref:SIS domain-containing protein n=1 Tax=Latilactobacillus TaxID=2767885 RepID=UPI002242D26E|nr:SIS domain-containing protein [Latilactobacillus curvatus]MCW8779197.1 SIS domain-containing protein [Latilactobacillus curvatus]